MLRFLTGLILLGRLFYVVYSWKTCAEIPFCSTYRHQRLSANEQFTAEVASLASSNNVSSIPLKNQQNQELILQISFLRNLTSRIKIASKSHKRYELLDVLEAEPKTVEFNIGSRTGTFVTLSPKTSTTSRIIVRKGPPFSIEFYHMDDILTVFDGSRFVMKNSAADESYHFDLIFTKSTKLYGLHHHATKLVLMETADGSHEPYRLRNSDVPGYKVGSTQALYGSIPVIWGHSTSKTSGVFLHNAADQWIDITYTNSRGPAAHIMVESAALDLFVMMGPTPKEVVRQYTELTGKAHLPQLWALGYHQCRYSYMSEAEVKDVIKKMDDNNFQMDAIWLDIDYTDGKKYFTWHPTNFKDPEGLQKTIAATKRKLITIIDPHIKVEAGYSVYDGAKNKYFVKTKNGNSDFIGECWPGNSSWIDFLNPEARKYWVDQYSYSKFKGSTPTLAGTWNDMNEPSVFNSNATENSLPGDALHVGNVKHRDVHNVYGFYQTKASHEALLQRDSSKFRPFVLTRSHFAGSQRYAAVWTGDNKAEFEYLAISFSECMLSNILGQVFCGADIGGFEGNPSEELVQRWYQAAIWLPFYRGHSNTGTKRREPYQYGDSVKNVIRKAIETRYRHIHTFYTLFFLHARYGDPICRPLFYEYPGMVDQDDHLLLGSDILAVPVLKQGATSVQVHFPGNNSTVWYRADLTNWEAHRGGKVNTIKAEIQASPYFYRGGSVITRKNKIKNCTANMYYDPFTIYSNLDTSGTSYGLLFNDDQLSFDYTKREFVMFEFIGSGNNLTMNIIDGDSIEVFIVDRVIVHSLSSEDPTKVVETVHTKTADGTPLIDLDLKQLLTSDLDSSYTLNF